MPKEISPLDGRYADRLGDLAGLFCEQALMQYRCRVELAYLEALADTGRFFQLDPAERADMVEDDGQIRVTCEYCSTVYAIDPATLSS